MRQGFAQHSSRRFLMSALGKLTSNWFVSNSSGCSLKGNGVMAHIVTHSWARAKLQFQHLFAKGEIYPQSPRAGTLAKGGRCCLHGGQAWLRRRRFLGSRGAGISVDAASESASIPNGTIGVSDHSSSSSGLLGTALMSLLSPDDATPVADGRRRAVETLYFIQIVESGAKPVLRQ